MILVRKKYVLSALLTISTLAVFAQQKKDSTKLPFAISDEKKLSDEDLKDKKEGAYLTGAPDISSDPVNGFGYGGEGELFFNGHRSDPFFAYTAYRAKLNFVRAEKLTKRHFTRRNRARSSQKMDEWNRLVQADETRRLTHYCSLCV